MSLGLDALGRKWASVLRQCAVKKACGLLVHSVYSSNMGFKERLFLEVSFDLEVSINPTRFNPYGMHCGTSWPDAGFPTVDFFP